MIVLDCNAAVEIARGSKDGSALAALMLDGERTIAPRCFSFELANVASKYVRGGYLTQEAALEMAKQASELVDEYQNDEGAWTEVVAESIRLGHAAYDLFYFVLARRNAATLFTLDRKLQRLCRENGVNCVEVDDEF